LFRFTAFGKVPAMQTALASATLVVSFPAQVCLRGHCGSNNWLKPTPGTARHVS